MVPPRSDRVSRAPPYSSRKSRSTRTGLSPSAADLSRVVPVHRILRTGLVRVRSPLLAESRLISFPPATEMFQFAGFASRTYGFSARWPSRAGFPHSDIHGSKPARGSPWLIAACYVLHRLSTPRHPPNALLCSRSAPPNSLPAGPFGPPTGKGAPRRRQHARPPFRGARALPSQSGNTSCAYWRTTCPNQCLLTMSETALPGLRRTGEPLEAGECLPPETWWSRTGSNRRPPACKAGALPTELRPLPGHLRALRRRAHDRAAGRHRDKWWAWIDLNYRPHPYQGCALTD